MDKPGLTGSEINLRSLQDIDSTGPGRLVFAHDVSVKHWDSVAIAGAQGRVLNVLSVTKMASLFKIS